MKDSDLEAFLKLESIRDVCWTLGWLPSMKAWHLSGFENMGTRKIWDVSGPDLLTVVKDALKGVGAKPE